MRQNSGGGTGISVRETQLQKSSKPLRPQV
jgi:hypothetical protein